jgi:hypothetical protein
MKPNNNPKVLITLSGGFAYVYADPNVDVAVLDLDGLKCSGTSGAEITEKLKDLMEVARFHRNRHTGLDGCSLGDACHPDIPGIEGGFA